jgi:hypothetical protein
LGGFGRPIFWIIRFFIIWGEHGLYARSKASGYSPWLAVALTMCLVVLGRHVDQPKFLDEMFGDVLNLPLIKAGRPQVQSYRDTEVRLR